MGKIRDAFTICCPCRPFVNGDHKLINNLKHVEYFSFLQVSMDIFEVNLVQSLQFLTVTGRNHVRHKNFSIMQR